MRSRQIVALDQLHDEGAHAAGRFFKAVDVRDVRMVQRGERLCFARETREAFGVARERVGQDFDRDVAIELRIARAIHLAHAACADVRDDFIDAEARAGAEGQTLVDYTGAKTILVACPLAAVTESGSRERLVPPSTGHERGRVQVRENRDRRSCGY